MADEQGGIGQVKWRERVIYADVAENVIDAISKSDVVPWSWLQSYADGKWYNYASDFIIEAKEAYERGEN